MLGSERAAGDVTPPKKLGKWLQQIPGTRSEVCVESVVLGTARIPQVLAETRDRYMT